MRLMRASSVIFVVLLAGCGGKGSDGDSNETGEPLDYGPVRGDLEITAIQTSQSVVQTIYVDGAVVNPASYLAPIVPGRHMWVQALWDPPLEWEPRALIGRLHLEYPDGTEIVLDDRETEKGNSPVVQGKSEPHDLLSGFYWRVDAEDMIPGLSYRVEVVEPEPRDDIPASTGKTAWPRESAVSMAVQNAPSELNLALVGIRYNSGGCSSDTTTLPEASVEAIRAGFESWNGVGSGAVNIDTDLTLDVDMPLDVFGLLNLGGMVRAEYADLSNVFFYFVFDDCTPGPNGVLGVAPVNPEPPNPGQAAQRYGVGLWHANNVQESVNTCIHEIGHSQGAEHAPCGGAAGPDPNYPHANGSIGTWGLDLLTAVFYDPAAYTDYMSYCRPYWTSDYRFMWTYNVQSTLTSWGSPDSGELEIALPAPPQGYTGEVLSGIVVPGQDTQWWIYDTLTPPASQVDGELTIALNTPAGTRAVAASVSKVPDVSEDARLVVIPLVDDIGRGDIASVQVHGAIDRSLAVPEILDAREYVTVHRRGQ